VIVLDVKHMAKGMHGELGPMMCESIQEEGKKKSTQQVIKQAIAVIDLIRPILKCCLVALLRNMQLYCRSLPYSS